MKHILHLFLLCGTITATAQSPYISKVWEYRPAPGQFVNTLPAYEEGDDANTMAEKAFALIGGDADKVISLGAWGGYVVFSFDHTILNQPGEKDFAIEGNAFFSADYADGGSAEPGIIMVSRDTNGNGLPDDEWYELRGSEYLNEKAENHYTLTYHRPTADHEATTGENIFITDITYIRWTDNLGGEGYVEKNMFHTQDYWPAWLDEDELTFSGARLPNNGANMGEDGSDYWVLYPFASGYVDNLPNTDEGCRFNLEDAIDSEGNPVALTGADFFKVYTAVNQTCGWVGETSTEVGRAFDLHPGFTAIEETTVNTFAIRYADGQLTVAGSEATLYSLNGLTLGRTSGGILSVALEKGVYIAVADNGAIRKFIVK